MEISLKFVPRVPINNIPALVQIMAWRRLGDNPLSEPIMDIYRRIYASLGLNDIIGRTFVSTNDEDDLKHGLLTHGIYFFCWM